LIIPNITGCLGLRIRHCCDVRPSSVALDKPCSSIIFSYF